MRTLIRATCLLAILLSMPASAQRVSQTAPAPNRNITAPGLQRPPGDHPEAAGSVEGYGDNWNMNSVQITAVTANGKIVPLATSGFHRFSADPAGPNARRLEIPIH
jgi:hypothetical protein